jgi:hypothetical protein
VLESVTTSRVHLKLAIPPASSLLTQNILLPLIDLIFMKLVNFGILNMVVLVRRTQAVGYIRK